MTFLVISVGLSSVTYAQQPTTIKAEVDRTELGTGEILTLVVTITGPLNPREPEIPEIDGIDRIGSPSTFRSTTVINDLIRSEITYHYRFLTTKEGDITIDPITVNISGEDYSTDHIKVRILRGLGGETPTPGQGQQADPRPAEDSSGPEGQRLYVEASVDNETPYLGEQVTYTFRFYRLTVFPSFGRFGQPRYQAPDFAGFWNNQETGQERYNETIKARRYTVVELQTVLFPTVVGSIIIEPARLIVPEDVFDTPRVLDSASIGLDVQALQLNAPTEFTGAVGQLDILAKVHDTASRVNEPITLLVSISGEGNIESLPDPAWPDFDGWRTFDSTSATNSSVRNGKLVGTRTYERILVPDRAGDIEIPSIAYPYFDPEAGRYVEARTDPITMSIAEEDGSFPLPLVAGIGKETVERIGADIRHIKPTPAMLRSSRSTLTDSVVYWATWGLPVITAFGVIAWQRRRTRIEGDSASVRRRNAMASAQSALTNARQSTGDPRAGVNQVIMTYLADQLFEPVIGLTHEGLARRLEAAGIPLDLIDQIQETLSAGEMAKYASLGADSEEGDAHIADAERLIVNLEEAFTA